MPQSSQNRSLPRSPKRKRDYYQAMGSKADLYRPEYTHDFAPQSRSESRDGTHKRSRHHSPVRSGSQSSRPYSPRDTSARRWYRDRYRPSRSDSSRRLRSVYSDSFRHSDANAHPAQTTDRWRSSFEPDRNWKEQATEFHSRAVPFPEEGSRPRKAQEPNRSYEALPGSLSFQDKAVMDDRLKNQLQRTNRDGAKWQRPEILPSTSSSGLKPREFSSDYSVSGLPHLYDDTGAFPLTSDGVLKRSKSQKKIAQRERHVVQEVCASTSLDYETIAAACATNGVSSRPLRLSRQGPKQSEEKSWNPAHSTTTNRSSVWGTRMARATADSVLTSATNSSFPKKRLFETRLSFRERAEALTRPQNVPSSSENIMHPDRQSRMPIDINPSSSVSSNILVDIDPSPSSVSLMHPDRQSRMFVDIEPFSNSIPFIHPDLQSFVPSESDSTQLQIESKPLETASNSKIVVKTDALLDDIDEFRLASTLVNRPKEQSAVFEQNQEKSLLSLGIENHTRFPSEEDTEEMRVEDENDMITL